MMERYYVVPRGDTHGIVEYEDGYRRPLHPCNNIVNHSPDGFAWGYGGSGPSQLALAIMVDATKDQQQAQQLYQQFKWAVVAVADGAKEFRVSLSDVQSWIAGRKP